MARKKTGMELGEHLVKAGLVASAQLKEARNRQARTPGFIGNILIELGFLEEADLVSFIVRKCRIPFVSALSEEIPEDVLRLVPRKICLEHYLIPVDRVGSKLMLMMVDPFDTEGFELVRDMRPDLYVHPLLGTWEFFARVCKREFGTDVGVLNKTRAKKVKAGAAKALAQPAVDKWQGEPCEIHVISNTHWDREWLCDFRETRMMLVEFFDRLLEVLDREPKYHSYLLDSQVVPVEDYIEVRPEKRDSIAKYVAAGRLFVGPWYTCPEGFCVNGESLVRNLLYGHKTARALGKVMKIGHTPFSYGQNSQMPQIYDGFGIDTILFYHGVSHDDTPNEFIFEGADGTRLLGSQMSSGARYNFYHNVYRRVLYGSRIDDREYAWTRGGLPFHLCGEDHCMEHHLLLDPVVRFDADCIRECYHALRDAETGTATTKYLAFMDGHDSSLPDTATLRIIEQMRKCAGRDVILHSSLPDWMAKVKKAARGLHVLRGERRIPKPMGARVHLYSDVLSCRTRMKRENSRAETDLERRAEPFAALAWTLGAEYPATQLEAAWKLLLKSHAHDSIAGTGVDDIERDMMHRLRQVRNISKGLARRALETVQLQIDNADASPDDVLLTVFNPSPFPRSEVITAVVDLPRSSGYAAFSLRDQDRKAFVPVQVVSRQPYRAVVNHAGDATAMMDCDRVKFHFAAEDVPGFGYATFLFDRKARKSRGGLVCGHNAMENEHLYARINPDGTLYLRHNKTGAEFDGLHYFEDGGEAGHAWMHIEPAVDSVVVSQGQPVRVSLEENGPLLARYKLEYRMAIPIGLDENGGDPWQRLDGGENASRRTGETRETVITSLVTLRKDARALEVITRFENACRNHRLRVMFPTRLDVKTCDVESAFDVVEREIEYGDDSPWADAIAPTFPMHRFVDLSDERAGLAVFNDGLREYEIVPNDERTVAITLMRAFEVALTTVSKRWEHHPEMTLSQCPGAHEFRYALYPHAGHWDKGEVFRECERFTLPLEPAQAGPHGGKLPKRRGFVAIEPANLVLSAMKRAEDGRALILRVFNPTDRAIEGQIKLAAKVSSAYIADMEEEPGEKLVARNNVVKISVPRKKIVTIKLKLS